MCHRCRSLIPLLVILIFLAGSCGPGPEPAPPASPSPEQAAEPVLPEETAIPGPSCPESFQDQDQIKEQSQLAEQGKLELSLGTTPSMPCSWGALEIEPPSLLEKIDQQTKWPAEGSTPQPGAPGTLIYQLQSVETGKAALSLSCTCLGEEGAEKQLKGTYLLSITIGDQ
jgi:hypothetical protein